MEWNLNRRRVLPFLVHQPVVHYELLMETDTRLGAAFLIGVIDIVIGTIGAVGDLDEGLGIMRLVEPVIRRRVLFEEVIRVLIQVEVATH